ncbi:MAG: hypothetical protein QOF87_3527 [Pseudonocardiales bacterium]|jgi:hypothetical protein|nr:hypothetical protein [Pseudonocardiales bacterium]MDT4963880.1 hypothetical protein [Pseudonocardiales bacterium]
MRAALPDSYGDLVGLRLVVTEGVEGSAAELSRVSVRSRDSNEVKQEHRES